MVQTTVIAFGCPPELDNKILFIILWLYDMEKINQNCLGIFFPPVSFHTARRYL